MILTSEYLIERLEKNCTNSKGYLGVEVDNLNVKTEAEKIELILFRVLAEIDYLEYSGHEETIRYGENKAFKSDYHVGLHIKRLQNFHQKFKLLFDEQVKKGMIH